MAGKGIRGGGGKVTSLDDARKKAGDRKDDGLPKNNLQAVREAEQAQLLSALAKIRPLIADVDAAKAIVKSKQELVNQALDHAAAAGFKKGEIRDLLKDTSVTGARKNLREAEERRARFRKYLGLPVGETDDGLLEVPEAAKDELDWRGHGYTAGLRADDPDPKKANVPPRFHPAWLEEWHRGQESNAWAMSPDGRPKPGAKLGDAVSVQEAAKPPAEGEEGFEAPASELAAQTSRPSTIESTDPAPVGEDADEGGLADTEALNSEPV